MHLSQLRRKALVAFLCALGCGAAIPATSSALVVGIGDQTSAMFSNPLFHALHLRAARLVVPWDVATSKSDAGQLQQAQAWLAVASANHLDPLVSFGRDNGKAGEHVPTVKQYTGAVKAFIKMFPKVKEYTAWNEPDWIYISLGKHPKLAAEYFNALVGACRHCTILAGDVYLPATGKHRLGPWLKAYIKFLHHRPAGWALHNYYDVRTHKASQLKVLESMTRGPIWLTEISGVEDRGHWQFHNQSPNAAGRDEAYLFSLPRHYHRIARIYHYQWQSSAGAGWDSGLLSPTGQIWPAYYVVRKAASH